MPDPASITLGNRSTTRTIAVETAAQAFLALLGERGIRYLFANAGTDFAPLLDAYARDGAAAYPRPITVPHETVAVAMAHGYYNLTGEPQAVMLHVGVGTANGVAGLINAARGNVPLLLMAGRTPLTEEGAAGSRDLFIHWAQETRDQAAMVREYVKWDYELRRYDQLETVVDRALAIAMTEPRGPVYLTLPREVLAEAQTSFTLTSPSRQHTGGRRYPDPHHLAAAAALLARAEHPLLITTSLGQDPAAVPELVTLAERFGFPVVVMVPRYMNFPSDHPLHLGYDPHPLLEEADVLLVIDSDVPWYPSRAKPRPDAHVIQMAVDPCYSSYPIRGYPCDIPLAAHPVAALPLLAEQLHALTASWPEYPEVVARRRERCQALHARRQQQWQEQVRPLADADAIDERWLSHCLGQALGEETILLNEYSLVPDGVHFARPGTQFMLPAAGGLGWGLGAALGTKLAAPERDVILAVGDGSYIFGAPTAAHFVAAAEQLPFLTVLFNNRTWNAVRRANLAMYPDGAAARTGNFVLSDLAPAPDYELLVQASGGHGERVEHPAALPAALDRALRIVREERRQALLNVICRRP